MNPDVNEVAEMAESIEQELRQMGAWQAQPLPREAYEFRQAFAADTMVFTQWLQFVFLPRVRSLIESGGPFPSASQVGVRAAQEFCNASEGSHLTHLLCEFDQLFTEPEQKSLAMTPENPLEEALIAASTDRAAEQTFYRLMLESTLYIIDDSPGPAPKQETIVTLQVGQQIQVRTFEIEGVQYTPIFSSLSRVRAVVEPERRYLAANGRVLLELMQGSHLALNPGSTYGKYFVPEETAALLSGDIFRNHTERVLTEDTPCMLGQPAVYPTHLTTALAARFQDLPSVKAAYLAHCVFPRSDETRGRTLIGIDVNGDWQRVAEITMLTVRHAASEPEYVDVVRIDDSELSEYLLEQTTPFYRAKA